MSVSGDGGGGGKEEEDWGWGLLLNDVNDCNDGCIIFVFI